MVGPEADQIQIQAEKLPTGETWGYRFTEESGKIEVSHYNPGEVYVNSQYAGDHSTAIYQTIYAWAHNNGLKVIEDPAGLSEVAELRRTSQMLSSALRFKTTVHIEPGPDSGIRGWQEGDTLDVIEHNVGLLALREARLVQERLKGIEGLRYDPETQSFYDGNHRIPDSEAPANLLQRIEAVDEGFSKRIGPATLGRALATLSGQGTRTDGSRWLVGEDAKASQALHDIRYARATSDAGGGKGDERSRSDTTGGESQEVSGESAEGVKEVKLPRASRQERDGSLYPERLAQAQEWVEKRGLSGLVELSDSASSISDPAVRLDALRDISIKGAYNPQTGKIHILLDRIGSKAEVERVLRHESLHHVFARVLREEFRGMLSGVRKKIPKERWDELLRDYPPDRFNDDARIEEYLAYLGQTNPQTKVWQDFVAWFRRMLRQAGVKLEVSDADIVDFLRRANKEIERKNIEKPEPSERSAALRFSVVGIDPERRRLYDKFISESYSTSPAYIADQSRTFREAAARAYSGGGTGTGASAQGEGGGRALSNWADETQRLISEEVVGVLPIFSDNTSEHIVRFRAGDQRVVKETKEYYYGEIPVADEGRLTSRSATPAEYLERMTLQMAVFHSDFRLEGIAISKELVLLDDPRQVPRIVVSQPWYRSIGDATQEKIDGYLSEAGFQKVPNSFYGWVRVADGVVIQDATPDNFVLTRAGLVPIDLQMNIFTPKQLRDSGITNR